MTTIVDGFVLDLAQVRSKDLPLVGGKAANLGELIQAGFPVPGGFALTTAAYDAVLAAAGVQVAAGAANTADEAAAVRTAIVAARLPRGVAADVAAALARLGGGAVAVRSSATAEDLPGATFAGQQDTYLNVLGPAAVIDAIGRCWASLWTDRAIAYREHAGIKHTDARMAVVVQRMVDATAAGVMFTANPVTGERTETVIDANPGLGEAVVGGLVTPEHVVLDATGTVVQHRAGRAEVTVRAVPGGGVQQRHEAHIGAVLGRETAAQLAALGRRIEAHFGRPQDVEWALASTGLWIVQARPLTALPPEPVAVGRLRRTVTAIVSELMPKRPFPMDMSTWTVHGHGRILTRMLAEIPAVRLRMADVLPEVDGVVDRIQPPTPRPTLRTAATPIRIWPRLRRFHAERWIADPRFAAFERHLTDLADPSVQTLPWADLVAIPGRALRVLDELTSIRVDYLPGAGLALGKLRVLLLLLGLNAEAGALTRGVHTRTSDANLALTDIAAAVAQDPAALRAFGQSDEALAAQLASTPELSGLRVRIDEFLREFGHRETTSAFVMSEPSWGDDPAMLFAAVRALLTAPGRAADPAAHETALARIDALRRVQLLRLGPRLARLTRQARAGIALREDTHFHAMRPRMPLRRAILEAGSRLTAVGVLERPADVMHLRLAELTAIADPAALPDHQAAVLRETVARRAATRATYAGAPLISPLTLRPHAARVSARHGNPAAIVTGTPACAGTVTGTARIVRDPSEFSLLQPGEILVCPYTNPSWTPLFQLAAAVVADTGGAVSHAAIVAREYGLPAVLGTANGTTAIAPGQRITVDGTAGTVTPATT